MKSLNLNIAPYKPIVQNSRDRVKTLHVSLVLTFIHIARSAARVQEVSLEANSLPIIAEVRVAPMSGCRGISVKGARRTIRDPCRANVRASVRPFIDVTRRRRSA